MIKYKLLNNLSTECFPNYLYVVKNIKSVDKEYAEYGQVGIVFVFVLC